MLTSWQILIGNLAVVGLILSTWAHVDAKSKTLSQLYQNLILATFLSLAVVASMMMQVQTPSGVSIDLRLALVALAGFESGLVGAGLAFIVATAFGAVLLPAAPIENMLALSLAALGGSATAGLTKSLQPNGARVLSLSAAFFLIMLPVALISHGFTSSPAPAETEIVVLTFNTIALLVYGGSLGLIRDANQESTFLREALAQAPDYLYVKDRDSRFVVANNKTAEVNNVASPEHLIGMSDFDLNDRWRAEELYHHEQEIMRTKTPMIDYREKVGKRTFVTSKYPLFDQSGDVIGIAGITRDITANEQLERELAKNRVELAHALEAVPDGFAAFDSDGVLLSCNRRYQQAFPLTGNMRIPGVTITDLWNASLEAGEVRNAGTTDSAVFLAGMGEQIKEKGQANLQLFDGRWLEIKLRQADKFTIVLVSDITNEVVNNEALRVSAENFQKLAEHDPLTGLLNRRAFNARLETELSRHKRNGMPLAAMMIDVDHFKAYNDNMGHQAGDVCLKHVAQKLSESTKRAVDVVARYGGEEFVVLLPDTSQEGAEQVAKFFLDSLDSEPMAHPKSPFGRVTASIGLSMLTGHHQNVTADELIAHADKALYAAKNSGRNRIEISFLVGVNHEQDTDELFPALRVIR